MQLDPKLLKESAESTKDSLMHSFESLAEDGLEDIIEDRLLKWKLETQMKMSQVFPYSEEYRGYENSQADSIKGRMTRESLSADISMCSGLSDVTKERWLKECETSDYPQLRSLHERLLAIWKDDLDRRKRTWEIDAIERRRIEFLDSMEVWLRFIESAKNALQGMGLGTGVLWDLSEGEGFTEDHSVLLKWAESFRKDPVLKRLCEMLGREMISSRTSEEQREVPVDDKFEMRDMTLKEEMSGIELGNRIEDLLPSELGMIDDPELSILFDLKFAENRLVNFSKEGYSSVNIDKTQTVMVEKDEAVSGPIIFCIDTSGSMTGTPEYIAKGVALYLAMRAQSEKRRCFLINFSTRIETIDITPDRGLVPMLDFLTYSFHGGTDLRPALEKAVDTLNEAEYSKADVLTVSDFVMPSDSLSYLEKYIDTAKGRRCRFHSLSIGSFRFAPKISEVFDASWGYDPATNSIKRL